MVGHNSFVHLHNHTEYSMLDGAARIEDLVSAASRMEMPAVAMTDHGNMFGTYEFWKAGIKHDVNPVIGIEAYLTPGTHRSDRTKVLWGDGGEDDVSGGGAYTHLTLWAETTEGLHNLFRLSSLASLEGQYFKPRMDLDLLQQYHEGVIATTGCPSSEVQTRLRLGQYAQALESASTLRDIFGPDNLFVEIMDHGLEIEKRTAADLLGIAKDVGLGVVATNDLHYTHAKDAKSHAALLCVQSGSTLDDPNRFKFDADEFYLKSPAQMRALFRDHPDACDNTLAIAERCNVSFNTEANYMPRFPAPDGESEESWFIKEVDRGLRERYLESIPQSVRRQADYETDVIIRMGFASYFLVVADYVRFAKGRGIRVGPGRGSGAGSMAAYALGITGLDPLRHGLIFERFLNPARISMPDFDIDFDERRRGEVIDYVINKYGDDRVAQIITYGTIKAKQALKDSARVLNMPYSLGEKLSNAVPPPIVGRTMELWGTVDPEHPRFSEAAEIREIVETDPDSKTVFETALGLENLKRQWGVHAAGVIMSSDPLIDIIPLIKREQDGHIITQFDFPSCEALGLVKMDFLGLRNLTILEDALDNIEQNRGHRPVLEDLQIDDSDTYELLARGDTLGVFQLDSNPIRSLLRSMKPDRFEDISAVIALYRPGPMGADSHTNYALRKNNQQEIIPISPELKEPLSEILDDTYGLIVYQEQVMTIAQKVAGFTLGEADILRRAMGKKKKEELDQQYNHFSEGMRGNGFSQSAVQALWNILLPFSDYAFNRSHSAAYGMLSYWTAYLKAHYPAEYMAALLTSVGDSRDKLAVYLNECRRMGIRVLAPDVNESGEFFLARGPDIRFGLNAISGVGSALAQAILDTRGSIGRFTSFYHFLSVLPPHALNKRTVEALIKAGAFDSFGEARKQLHTVMAPLLKAASAVQHDRAMGNHLLGNQIGQLPKWTVPTEPVAEWDRSQKLEYERKALGLYVSDHPLSGLDSFLAAYCTHSVVGLMDSDCNPEGKEVTVGGIVTGIEDKVAKSSGNNYAVVQLQDLTSEIQLLLFGSAYKKYAKNGSLFVGGVFSVTGRITRRDDQPNLLVDEIMHLDTRFVTHRQLLLRLPAQEATVEVLRRLGLFITEHPGNTPVKLKIMGKGWSHSYSLPNNKISAEALSIRELKNSIPVLEIG